MQTTNISTESLKSLLEIIQRTSGDLYAKSPAVKAANSAISNPVADEAREALYHTSEDISSALMWLDGLQSASDRITGARACLRKSEAKRANINRTTDAMKQAA